MSERNSGEQDRRADDVPREVRQQAGTIQSNPVRLDRDRATQIVEALNVDLAATGVVVHQLRKHSWCVSGPNSRDVRSLFVDAATDIDRHRDVLARRVTTLGGVPRSSPAALERHSPIPFEGADVYDARTSLANDRQALGDLVESLSSHVELAESLGDHSTGNLLRDLLVAVERSLAEIDALLARASRD